MLYRVKMKKNSLVLALLLLLASFSQQAKALTLSPGAQVSLVTVAPGEELYDSFGHTAIWVYDPSQGIDRVYGYGTYNFAAPNFYWKFVRGQLDYMISVMDMGYFIAYYQGANRSVTDQVLALSPAQKDQIYAFLEKNYLPENRYYKYDFFFDNCTSRVRDVLKTICGDSLQYHYNPPTRSFRQWIDLYLQHQSYADFGMDLGLGDRADRKATWYESMFLPNNLRDGLASATLVANSKPQPIVLQTRELFKANPAPFESTWFTPTVLFWLVFLLVAVITFVQFRRPHANFSLDRVLFGLVGLVGVILTFLWFGTDHGVTVNNWNLGWAWPSHLIVALLLRDRVKAKWMVSYFLIYSGMVSVFVLGWPFWPQEVDYELLPLVLTFGLRGLFTAYRLNKNLLASQPASKHYENTL